MGDRVIVTGDTVRFEQAFGAAMVVVQPGTIAGSGRADVGGKPICVQGDETRVLVPGCAYTAGAFSVAGVGILAIDRLGADQLAQAVDSGGKKLILQGAHFVAKFTVVAPAQMPPPASTTDVVASYPGQGSFEAANTSVEAG